VLVQETIADALVEKIARAFAQISPGDPQAQGTTFGPLATARQRDVVEGMVERAKRDGAQMASGGARMLENTGGYFFAPTVFHRVDPHSELAQHEVFGPVLAVTSFKDMDEAVRLARSTRYGLAAYVWSANPSVGFGIANALQTAITLVNASNVGGAGPGFSFSGEPAGLSGVGVEGGLAGLEAYTRRQTIWINHG
jgi:acyl-CoA reductase-like NAD-dependent aldehyde dehydrogenase